jgi:hypothetical protein
MYGLPPLRDKSEDGFQVYVTHLEFGVMSLVAATIGGNLHDIFY